MSILIGMEMPKNCFLCPLSVLNGERLFCEVTKDEVIRAKRSSCCPLCLVPPHGRLIDADKLVDSFEPSDFWNSDAEDNCFAAVRIVHSAPAIIPASDKDINVLGKEEGET